MVAVAEAVVRRAGGGGGCAGGQVSQAGEEGDRTASCAARKAAKAARAEAVAGDPGGSVEGWMVMVMFALTLLTAAVGIGVMILAESRGLRHEGGSAIVGTGCKGGSLGRRARGCCQLRWDLAHLGRWRWRLWRCRWQ